MLSEQINPDSGTGMNLFSGYMIILDKKLINIQENTIDVKTSLENIEEKKHPKKELSLWEKIRDFFIDMFN